MKLVRYGPAGREKPGIVDSEGKIRDLSRIVKDIDAEAISPKGLAKIKKANINRLKVVPGKPRLGSCVTGTRHFVAIGLNFSDHALGNRLAYSERADHLPEGAELHRRA